MNTTEQASAQTWFDQLMKVQRLGFQRTAEGWLVTLDGFLMSHGETQEVAIGWAYVMSHKSAYE
ncbi:hypothetical protein ACFOHT_11995 [Massilia oculi]|jgi:hypothetical protein|uniref:PH domain-containing protein n=1 Tax=Massilia oculi TaxID=945844 RepID=A0A2S2DGU8_9BURK|nr:hypothetical protein [Massilia oculi]AWL04613.1 hypothetical protein DIR46_09285 [Massilia oculi]